MQNDHALPGIRRLWPTDEVRLVAHFNRLDPKSRRMRFMGGTSETFVRDYAAHLLSGHCLVLGAFPGGQLRGVAELHPLPGTWPPCAEAAFSVEPGWQSEGIGEALFNRLIAAARNRGIRRLEMHCLRENEAMQKLARRHSAQLTMILGDVEGQLQLPWPSPASLAREVMGETDGYFRAVLSLPHTGAG